MADKDPLVNLGRNVAPDQWKNYGDWGSGSHAVDAGSSWNSVSIDMTQYSGLILSIDSDAAFAVDGLGVSFQRLGSAAGRKIQWGAIDGDASSMQEFDTEDIANPIVANETTYFVFNSPTFPLLGMDDVAISLKNQEGGSRLMNEIKYRRTGFKPAG